MPLNDTFLKACRGEQTDYTPVWLMRQAGRYMKEYRDIRKKYDFLEICKTPELAVEVTMQPVNYMDVDAAILFSDILIPVEAMGLNLRFAENQGPILDPPVQTEHDIVHLKFPQPGRDMAFTLDAIVMLRELLNDRIPLIGFAGAPFTLASYMVEGKFSKNHVTLKRMMYERTAIFDVLMSTLADVVSVYLEAQIKAGVQAIQLFDTWAGLLSPQDFEERNLPHIQSIFKKIKYYKVPLIYYTRNSAGLLPLLKKTGADVISLDWQIDLGAARTKLGKMSVQGNLDPCALFLEPVLLRERIRYILDQNNGRPGHIFNLGHGVLPETNPEQAKLFIDTVHQLSGK